MARDIAATGTWRCAITDPTHATLLGLGTGTYTPTYHPTQRLRRFLQSRDRVCRVPGCNTPAELCDIDHRTPWLHNGPTCECNTECLCKTHHKMKHECGVTLTPSTNPNHPPGTLIWTTPAGHGFPSYPPQLADPDPVLPTEPDPPPPAGPDTNQPPNPPNTHPLNPNNNQPKPDAGSPTPSGHRPEELGHAQLGTSDGPEAATDKRTCACGHSCGSGDVASEASDDVSSEASDDVAGEASADLAREASDDVSSGAKGHVTGEANRHEGIADDVEVGCGRATVGIGCSACNEADAAITAEERLYGRGHDIGPRPQEAHSRPSRGSQRWRTPDVGDWYDDAGFEGDDIAEAEAQRDGSPQVDNMPDTWRSRLKSNIQTPLPPLPRDGDPPPF